MNINSDVIVLRMKFYFNGKNDNLNTVTAL